MSLENTNKPNFGTTKTTDSTTTTQTTSSRMSVGAIWERVTNKDGTKFLSITGDVPQLKKAIEAAEKAGNNRVGFVAFSNNKGDNPKRPDYRIFEEIR